MGSFSISGWDSDFRSWWSNGFIRFLATLFVAALTVSWLIKKLSTRRTPAPLPPGPRGLPLLGNLPFLEPELHRYFAKLSKTYGPIFKLRLGSKICVVVSSPSIARIICKDQDAVFANRNVPVAAKTATYGGIDIGWCPNGPRWRKLRKVFANHMMSSTSLDACYALRRGEVRDLVKEIHKNAGSPINICEQLFLTLLNVMMSMLWGGSLHGEERSVGIEFRQVVVEIIGLLGQPNVSDLFPILSPFDLQGINSKVKKLSLWFDRIFESIIDARRRNKDEGKTSKDLLHFLLELMNRQGDDQTPYLSMDEMKALFMVYGFVCNLATSGYKLRWIVHPLFPSSIATTELHLHRDRFRQLYNQPISTHSL